MKSEILPEKADLAQETFQSAQVEETVQLVQGNVLQYLQQHPSIAFCFLDAEKEIYSVCYDAVIPKLVKGGWLVADNAINHRAFLQPMIDRVFSDERVDALIVPIGKGELLCRKL